MEQERRFGTHGNNTYTRYLYLIFQYDVSESMDELSVLEARNHFVRLLSEEVPLICPNYMLPGTQFSWFYYLDDQMFSPSNIFSSVTCIAVK